MPALLQLPENSFVARYRQLALTSGQTIHNGEQALMKLAQEDMGRLPREGKIDKTQPLSAALKLYNYLY